MPQPSGAVVQTESPVRLVRVGVVTVRGDGHEIVSLDEAAQTLLGDAVVVGRPLLEVVVPVDAQDAEVARGRAPGRWLGEVAQTSSRLLVQTTPPPPSMTDTIVSLVSVNEYLAESQALARVQLRDTVEAIIAGFAHEVRNPLAAILSLTESALQHEPPDSVLVRVPGLVQRVESLLQHSLAYSRPKAPHRTPHQLSYLVHRAVGLLRRRPAPTPRFVLRGIGAAHPAVMVDHLQAEQVLVNLFENALDAAREEVIVRVLEGASPAHAVCLEVADDGDGVPPEMARKIFDPFFTTKAHGTGLGLAIARDLTRLNGGDLRLVPRTGGAVFHVLFSATLAPIRAEW